MPADVVTDRLLATVTWEWQDVEALMDALIPTVAPGKALRAYQTRAAGNKGTGSRPQLNEDEQIASGARQIVNERIATQLESGRLEVERDEGSGRRRVRFRERVEVADARGCCPTCNRPFAQATVETTPPAPSPRSKVVYPAFPQWTKQLSPTHDGGSSG